ncbi:MAG: MFS transporter [Thiotrichales bacterium]|nr:MAG: MFS transporter [Thiotrichales bacterium]
MSEQGKPDSQPRLMVERRFLPFFITQFLGAFNDNVFKNALIILIAFQGSQFSSVATNTLTNLSAGLFILPFFLLSATAGQLIDKTEKSLAMRRIKMLEIFIMLCAAWAFSAGDLYLLIALLFLMGAQSTLFGPAKYSYIPQHLADNELIAGNALVQMGTFVAILIGTMVGGLLIAHEEGRQLVSIVLVVIAVLGFAASLVIPKTPSPCPELKINWNMFTETWRNIAFIRSNRTVFLSVLGVSWFWFLGATYLVQLPNYTKLTLGGNEQVVTMLLTLFTLGIGSGSLLCNWLSGQKVEIGLVPFGSIGLTLFGIDLYLARPVLDSTELLGLSAFLQQSGSIRVIIDVVLIGIFGGFYIVPLFALIQQRSDPEHLSRVIAGNNILNALLMVLSAVISIVLLGSGVSIAQLFLVVAVLNAAVAIYIYTLVPEFLMRFLVWILIHSVYHVRKTGLENIPDQGPAVLVCNHVSYVDAMIIAGCIRRPVRFVMYYKIYNLPLIRFVSRTARAIPIAGAFENKELMETAFDEVDRALNEGDVVCIFPEGRLTADGTMRRFKSGVERIVERTPVPVISMCLYGLWGSAFSRHPGFILWRIINGIRSRIDFSVSTPQDPAMITVATLQERVAALCTESAKQRGY